MYVNLINRHHLKNVLPYIFIILMVISTLAFQMAHPFFINGIDSFFHMSIAYDTYRQFRTGHFSYFMSAFGFYHSLRIVNAVYGPLGGYLSGFLLLITGSWIRWEIVTFLIVFTIAGISMYQLCRYWQVTRIYSVLIGCLYIFSFPIMSLWLNSQYDGFGAAFMPWALYFGSHILNHDFFKNWKLILLLVVLAEIHVFSMLLALLVLGMCYLFSLAINKDFKTLTFRAIKVLLITLTLSFNVWGGILEVLHSNPSQIVPTYSFTNMMSNVWGAIGYNHEVPISQNLFLLGLSTTVLLAITIVFYIFMAYHLNIRLSFIMLGFGALFLWLSSRWFPWTIIQRHFPILDTDLQFPKRFLPVSLTAFGLMLGVILSKLRILAHHSQWLYLGLVIILGLFTIHAWHNTYVQSCFLYHEQTTAQYYVNGIHHSTGDMWLTKPKPRQLQISLHDSNPGRYFQILTKTTPDYLPSDQKIMNDAEYHKLGAYNRYLNQIVKNRLKYHYQYAHHIMRVSFNQNSTNRITVPFVKYRHTLVKLNGRNLKHFKLTTIGAVNIKPHLGHNVMTFKYKMSRWYTAFMGLSALVWLLFIIGVFRSSNRSNKNKI